MAEEITLNSHIAVRVLFAILLVANFVTAIVMLIIEAIRAGKNDIRGLVYEEQSPGIWIWYSFALIIPIIGAIGVAFEEFWSVCLFSLGQFILVCTYRTAKYHFYGLIPLMIATLCAAGAYALFLHYKGKSSKFPFTK